MAQTAYLTIADFAAAGVSEPTLLRYAPGDTHDVHPIIDGAILAASGEVDEYLLRRGVTPPLTVPVEDIYRQNLIDLAIDYLTRRADRRPASIDANAKLAREFFEKVATGRIDVDNPNAGPGQPQILSQSPFQTGARHSAFDSNDPNSDISSILPPIGGWGSSAGGGFSRSGSG